jgi:hypothetical protein
MSNRGIQLIEEDAALVLQHVNFKFFLKDPEPVDLQLAVPLFHSWIQAQATDELLLDVASYAHVKDGPGILLIGHEADYSLDLTDGQLGFRYNRKAPVEGDNPARLRQAARAALKALDRLEKDERLGNKINFNGRDIQLFINDRLLAPTNIETQRVADHDIRPFLSEFLAGEAYSLAYEADPRRLFGARVHVERPVSVTELLQNLDGC